MNKNYVFMSIGKLVNAIHHCYSGFLSSWILGIVGPIKCTILGGILVSSGLIASSLAQNIALIVLFLGILTGRLDLTLHI